MRKRLGIAFGGLLTVCLCVALVFVLMPACMPGVTWANSYRIQIGMTEKEVEALMGCPGRPFHGEIIPSYYKRWGDEKCGNVVSFDENGNVDRFLVIKNTSTHFIDANESVFEKLGQWLHLTTKQTL